MTRDELFEQIQRALLHGVKIDNKEDTQLYLLSICRYINEQTHNRALFQNNKLIIESSTYDPILSLEMSKDTLYINPLGEDDFFNSFMSVLKFMGTKNKPKEVYDDEFDWV